MRHSRFGFLGLAVLTTLAVLGAIVINGSPGLAQSASPPRPSHVHEGDCDEPGAIVQGLTALTVPTGPTAGNSEAVLAEAAFSSIPLSVDQMLAADHSLKVHLSTDQIDTYLVCGDVGGALDADGALIVGLKEQDGSGYTGIAYLVPDANGQTSVSVMIAKVLPGGGAGDDAGAAAPDAADSADEAADTGAAAAPSGVNVVGVTLTEFSINMPTELPAGPTQFNITNVGTVPHNFVIEGNGLAGVLETNLEPRTSGQLSGDLEPGTYTIFCPVGQGAHRSNGMEVAVTVN